MRLVEADLFFIINNYIFINKHKEQFIKIKAGGIIKFVIDNFYHLNY